MQVTLELKEVEDGNIHRIICKRYSMLGELIDELCVGYIESRLADLVKFDDMNF